MHTMLTQYRFQDIREAPFLRKYSESFFLEPPFIVQRVMAQLLTPLVWRL